MESIIGPDQEQEKLIRNMGYDFALEGLSWEDYKPLSLPSQVELLEREKELFMEGYRQGIKASEQFFDKKREVTRSR